MISTARRRAMGLSDEEVSSSSPVCTAAIEELAKGLESVARLAALRLFDPSENCRFDASKAAGLLIEEIMETLSKAIAVLKSGKKHNEQMAAPVDSPSPVVTSKGYGGKRKMQSTRKSVNRKRGHPYSCTRVTSATAEDGCTWRKYGQKEIFSSKHPRSYYRCSHKHDRGCTATRQVQKSEDNPSLYVITYFGEHTCEREAKNTSTCREPCVINIEPSTTSGIKQETPFSSFPSYKQESEEEVHSNLTCSDSLSDYFVSAEVELQETSMVELETLQSESTSGLPSSITNYEMNFMDLEDLWSFDHNELFL